MIKKWMLSVMVVCLLGAGAVSAAETGESEAVEAGAVEAGAVEVETGEAANEETATEKVEATEEVEAVTHASVTDYYGDFGLSGDALMEAINTPAGSYVIATVNEDGTPQLGFFVYSMMKEGDTYYLALGLAENQTRENLERTGEAMAIYAANPGKDADAQYAVSGARMSLKLVTDEKLAEKLNTAGYDTTMFCEVEWAKPLG